MTTYRDVLSKNHVTVSKGMSAGDILRALARVPAGVLAMIHGISALITALNTATTAAATARQAYQTAQTTYVSAKSALDDYNAAQATSKGDPSGAAYVSAKAAQSAKQSATEAAVATEKAAVTSVDSILDQEITA